MTRFLWPAAGAQRHLFHYTRAESAAGLLHSGVALVGPRSDYGVGFYATDLAPDAHHPAEIHASLLPGWPRLWNAVVMIEVDPDGRPFEEAVAHHWLIPEADRVVIGDRIAGIAIFDEAGEAWSYGEGLADAPREPTAPTQTQIQTLADERGMARGLLTLLSEDQARVVRQPSLHAELAGASYPLSEGQLARLSGATEPQLRRWADLRLIRCELTDGAPRFWPVAAATAAVLAAGSQHAKLTAAEIARGDGARSIALIAEALSVWSRALDGERAARAQRAGETLSALVAAADSERHEIAIPDLLHALSTTLDSIRRRVASHGAHPERAGPGSSEAAPP